MHVGARRVKCLSLAVCRYVCTIVCGQKHNCLRSYTAKKSPWNSSLLLIMDFLFFKRSIKVGWVFCISCTAEKEHYGSAVYHPNLQKFQCQSINRNSISISQCKETINDEYSADYLFSYNKLVKVLGKTNLISLILWQWERIFVKSPLIYSSSCLFGYHLL